MKPLFLLAFFLAGLVLHVQAAGGIPAKEALRTVARVRGASWLERVVQVNGDRGADQPVAWHIVANDGKGGLREFFVNGKGIVSEGPVPAKVATALRGPVVESKKFVTDSTHAFVAANNVAKRVRLGFDSANFRLRCGANSTTPVWNLELLDAAGMKRADVSVSAVSGKVLNSVIYPQPLPPPQAPAQTRQGMDKARDAVTTGVKGVGRGLQRAGSWIHRKFTPQPRQ
jgi:hypothetical protein